MTELQHLMAQATDRIESPGLEWTALQIARRRRTRRRGTAAAVGASALIVAVFLGMQGFDRATVSPPSVPSSQTPTPTHTTSEPVTGEKVWRQWDPRDADQLPAAADRVAPALPEVIDPPASSPLLRDDPVSAAVLAVWQEGIVQVLGTDGGWRRVPIDGRFPVLSFSPGGTELAIYYNFDQKSPAHDWAVTVYDLGSGKERALQPPAGFELGEGTGWSFLDEDTLLFSSGPTAYGVDVDSGDAEQTTVPDGMSVTLDPAGNWLSSADFSQPNVLTDYAGGSPRQVSMDQTGRLSRIIADEDTVAGTTYDDQPFSVVVADRETLTPQFRLPVLDHDANYSNGGLRTIAVADDGTILLHVAAIGRQLDGFRVVAWEPTSGELSIVSSTALPVEAGVVIASEALRAIGPN